MSTIVTRSLTKKHVIILLLMISLIAIPLKLYTVEFSLPVQFDNLGYALDSMQYSEGDFFIPPKKNPGWPLFASPFMSLVNSENFLDYSNLMRTLSLGISVFTIFPMYILLRKFFNEKYSLVGAALFAFEPHLNYISAQGLSEPLFILLYICSFLFILNKNSKIAIIGFMFAGFVWWVRLEGAILFISLSIIYLVNLRHSKHSIRNFMICILIFLIVVSPMFLQRNAQYGEFFYMTYGGSIFVDEYSMVFAKNVQENDGGALQYIEKRGIGQFVDKFIIGGASYISEGLTKISFPYLIILLIFGLILALRPVSQNHHYTRANWIVMLTMIGVLLIPFSVIHERRFLYPLYPFLIIFAVLPIQRLVEYGFSTFSFSKKQKTISLLIILSLVVILSTLFTVGVGKYGYGQIDLEKENEKIEYAKFLVNELDGRMFAEEGTADYTRNIAITEDPNIFKNYKSSRIKDPHPDNYEPGKWVQISIHGKDLVDMINNGESYGLKYIAIPGHGSFHFEFLDDVYNNEKMYPYLEKVFDSNDQGFKKFHVKVFEINYEKFQKFILNE